MLIFAKLDHPNIVRYHSTWTQHRLDYRSYRCRRLSELQRTLSLEQAPHLSDGCGDCTKASEQLVIEEVHGASASGGSTKGQVLAPALLKGAQLCSEDFARAPGEAMWSTQWSDTEEEEDAEEQLGRRASSGQVNGRCDPGRAALDRVTLKLLEHGHFSEPTPTSVATSSSVVRSVSVESKSTVIPVRFLSFPGLFTFQTLLEMRKISNVAIWQNLIRFLISAVSKDFRIFMESFRRNCALICLKFL